MGARAQQLGDAVQHGAQVDFVFVQVSMPDSILEKSRMSPIRVSSASPDWVMASA